MKLIILLLVAGKVHSLGIPALDVNCLTDVIHLVKFALSEVKREG
jgi:hypothetical protein